MIRHYLKVAFRNLLKYKIQSFISTMGLAVGLLCFSICFYCSRYMQSMDQCFDNYHRLVDIRLVDGEKAFAGTPAFPLPQEAIGKRMVMTRRLGTSPETTPRSGGITYMIQAVIKDIPTNISMNFMRKIDALILNDSEGLFSMKGNNDQTGTCTYGLLWEGQTPKDLERQYRKAKLTHRMFDNDCDVVASAIGKEAECSNVATVFSLATSIAGILILLVSLLNFFHFQIGSIINRQREFSIRKVLGNGTIQLSMMLFTQLFLVIVAAALFEFGLIEVLASSMQISFFELNMAIESNRLMVQAGEYIVLLLVITFGICISAAFYIRKVSIKKVLAVIIKEEKASFVILC